jgi:hypothetical protein
MLESHLIEKSQALKRGRPDLLAEPVAHFRISDGVIVEDPLTEAEALLRSRLPGLDATFVFLRDHRSRQR